MVVFVGCGETALGLLTGGRVTVAPTPTTWVGLIVKVFLSTTTVDVGLAGLSVNVWSSMTTTPGFTVTVTGGGVMATGVDLMSCSVAAPLP